MRQTNASRDVPLILAMLAVIALPMALTLHTVHQPVGAVPPEANPTPWGYTVSLLLFLAPVLAIGVWHLWEPKHPSDRSALLLSCLAVAAIGTLLDIFFGYHFFVFRNPGATLRIRVPAWNFSDWSWVSSYLPVEEFAFYVFGAFFVVTVYIWAGRNWLPDFDLGEYQAAARRQPRLISLAPWALVAWPAAIGAAFLYKKQFGPVAYRDGIPGYFIFQMVLGVLPTFVFFRGVRDFINWRAFAFSLGALLPVSIVWEATLGVPYDWWNYKPEQMIGIRVMAWAHLPFEAVMLWLVVAWVAVIVYEIFKLYGNMGCTAREALFGVREQGSPQPRTEARP